MESRKRSPLAGLGRLLFWRSRSPRDPITEEGDWRRRLILASRKLQQVQMALTADMADVRGLRRNLDNASPEIDRLEQELTVSRDVIGSLERKLDDHAELLRAQASRMDAAELAPAPGVDAIAYEARLAELENELERARTQLVQERETHAEELAALEASQAGGDPAAAAELEAVLAQSQAHAADLERRSIQVQEERELEATRHAEEIEGLERVSSARISELEAQLVMIQTAADSATVRQDQETGRALEEARKRVATLELQLRGLESLREDLERAHDEGMRLKDASTQRITQLETRLRSLEDDRGRMILEHEEELSKLRSGTNSRVSDLEAEVRRAGEERRPLEEEMAQAAVEHREQLEALEAAHEELRREQGRELAESAARIMELEAFNEEIAQARLELEERLNGDDKAQEELLARARESELLLKEMEECHAREVSDLKTLQENQVKELKVELEALRKSRADHSRKHLDQVNEQHDTHARLLAELQRQVREGEMARLELETRHTKEMSDLADHSWESMQNLEQVVREKEESLRSLTERNRELEGTVDRMRAAPQEKERTARPVPAKVDSAQTIGDRADEPAENEPGEPTLVRLEEDVPPPSQPTSARRAPAGDEPTVVYLPEEMDEATRKRQAEFESRLGQMLGGWLLSDDEKAAS